MGFFDMFKAGQYKKELENEKLEYEKLKQSITPEMQNALTLVDEIKRLEKQIEEEKKRVEEITELYKVEDWKKKELEKIIDAKKKEVDSFNDEILVQEFGLYKPRFEFASSTGYQEVLTEVRDSQKYVIKNKGATTGSTTWTVNGNNAQGKKMISDTQKLLLRAFNSDCDELVAKVKYTNFEASLDRMRKSAETISRLGKVLGISITKTYLDLKELELSLAFEYQIEKQKEKEALRAAREEQREQAKVQKEIEEERKKVKKEQAHYQTALEQIEKQLETNPTDENLLNKKEELLNKANEINKALSNLDYRQANAKAGYVYIISNIGAFGENIFKIGMTRRLDPQERIDELGDASVPFRFDVHAMIFSNDAPKLESALHKAFESKKLNMVNQRREFFKVTLDEIKEVIRANYDKTVEFYDVPDAEQYRISLKMKETI